MNTRTLLADYVALLNRYGPTAEEAEGFIDANRDNEEFVQLAWLSRMLQQALTLPS